jgi:hypothetical protein
MKKKNKDLFYLKNFSFFTYIGEKRYRKTAIGLSTKLHVTHSTKLHVTLEPHSTKPPVDNLWNRFEIPNSTKLHVDMFLPPPNYT